MENYTLLKGAKAKLYNISDFFSIQYVHFNENYMYTL